MKLLDIHEPGETPLPHENHASVGIDLGTTNSLVAIANRGTQEIIPDSHGRALLPSVVSYGKDGKVTVGHKAMKNPQAIHSIKRLMGRGAEDAKAITGHYPYPFAKVAEGGMIAFDIGGKKITPVEIAAEILRALKAQAERELENIVDKAVITVPAYFDDAARQATRDAAHLAGLEVLRLVNEPTAAALAYGLDNAAEGIYAVYDLGGGTFDVSLLKMEKGIFQVLATGGDTALGGDDFDYIIAEYLSCAKLLAREAKEVLTENEVWQLPSSPESRSDSRAIHSTTRTGGKMDAPRISFSNSGHDGVTLTRTQINELILPLVERTVIIFRHVLADAGISHEALRGVVMVGGSTRVPLVREKLEAFVGKKLLTDVDPDKVVAIGAALQAEALTQGSDNLLLDVTPLSLGLETIGGLVEVLIPRNTPIPAAKSQKFTTYQDGQTGMVIHVLQGEREMVDQCRSLARFELKNIPSMLAGAAIIEVTFTLDADGILSVRAREETTGTEQKILVKPTYGLPPEAMETMLRESMEHAREDITRRLLAEARVDADIAIRAVEAALVKDGMLIDADYRKKIMHQVQILREAIREDDRDAIDYGAKKLEEICSPFAEKRVNRALGSYLKGKRVETL